jgi:hypothetical protein
MRRSIWFVMATALVLSLTTMTGAGAVPDPDTTATPNGPWVTENQQVKLQAFLDYDELTDRLQALDRRHDNVEVESIGTTGEDRDIWLAKIGDPNNTPVMIINQQHGDEPHGAEASVDLIQRLATGAGKDILDELYVLIVPRVNPDGATIPERGNLDVTAPERDARGCFNADGTVNPDLTDQGRGVYTTDIDRADGGVDWSYDINRYHWPDWTESWQYLCNPGRDGVHFGDTNPVPEAVAVLDAYAAYQPIWVVDVHNQDIDRVEADAPESDAYRAGQRITSSALWPTNEDVREEAVDLSKQLVLAMKLRSLELGHSELTRYNGGSFPGIARNAYGLIATDRIVEGGEIAGGSVLLEISGQTEGDLDTLIGQKAIGKSVTEVRQLLLAVLDATADGSLFELDPDLVDELVLANDEDLDNRHRLRGD